MPAVPDLNLLLALEALLEERSVTRAAARLGLTQPTLSASLARLRRHYDDELLQRRGNAYQLTPLAERLQSQVPQALAFAEQVFDTPVEFDPATSVREFTLVLSDVHVPLFGRALVDLLRLEAPHCSLRLHHSAEVLVHAAAEHLPTVDGFLLPRGLVHDVPSIDLYEDEVVCVASRDDPADELGTAHLQARPWVLHYHRPGNVQPALTRLRSEGVEPRVEVSTEDFLATPHLVAGTDRLAVVPRRLTRLPGWEGLKVVRLPFALGRVIEALSWHPDFDRDPGHEWFRLAAVRAAATL